ncbi:MAG: hypothetical protein Q8O93_01105 [bacterium]|nr:hypothetical protein [bacterium]
MLKHKKLVSFYNWDIRNKKINYVTIISRYKKQWVLIKKRNEKNYEFPCGKKLSVFKTPSKKRIDIFLNKLRSRNLNVFYKPSQGKDILAACGQLMAKK